MRDTERLKAKYGMILQEREKHGDQSVEDFCKRYGISAWTFYYWKKRLRRASDCPLPIKRFVPIQVMPSRSSSRDTVNDYEIRFPNGYAMRISGAMPREDISFIMRKIAAFPL